MKHETTARDECCPEKHEREKSREVGELSRKRIVISLFEEEIVGEQQRQSG